MFVLQNQLYNPVDIKLFKEVSESQERPDGEQDEDADDENEDSDDDNTKVDLGMIDGLNIRFWKDWRAIELAEI